MSKYDRFHEGPLLRDYGSVEEHLSVQAAEEDAALDAYREVFDRVLAEIHKDTNEKGQQ